MDDQRTKLPQFVLPRGFTGRVTYMVMGRAHNSIYRNVAEVLAPRPDDDLLEVACGNGQFLKKYAPEVHSIAGLDLSEVGVQAARKKHAARIAAGTGEFVQGDAGQLPWPDGSFTAVTAMNSVIAFPQPVQSMKEIHRVLRPGGRAVISIEWHAGDGKDYSKDRIRYRLHIWSEDEVRSMMEEAGFSDVTITYAAALGAPQMMLVQALKQ